MLDETSVYWLGGGVIRRAPKKGGTETIVVADPRARRMALDGSFLYWTSGTSVLRIGK